MAYATVGAPTQAKVYTSAGDGGSGGLSFGRGGKTNGAPFSGPIVCVYHVVCVYDVECVSACVCDSEHLDQGVRDTLGRARVRARSLSPG